MSQITVITAFYEIPSKFTTEQYWIWIKNFLSNIPCYLVIFTTENLKNRMEMLRSEYKDRTFIIVKPFDQLYHYKFIDEYINQRNKDWCKTHSPELYIIWAEKVKFVMDTIQKNPFSSELFIWCDIGVFRQTQFLNRFKTFPKEDNIKKGKMNLLLLQEFRDCDMIPVNGIVGQNYFNNDVRLGGGIQGADIQSWKVYDKRWDEMLQRYFQKDKFAGQDQCIIGSVYLENPDLFNVIRPQYYGGDEWFYLLYYWS